MSPEGHAETTNRPVTARVFFAIWPPPVVARYLGEVARNSAASLGGRATRSDSIHLTLAFLGDVPETRLGELCAVAEGIDGEAFTVRSDHLGFWSHNRLLWAGINRPAARLDALVRRLRIAMADSGFKADVESKPFVPHLTLVRKIPVCGEMEKQLGFLPFRSQSWQADRFFLVRSELSETGSRYRVLGTFLLS